MSRSQLMFLSAVILTSSASANGDWTYNPSTGHWYQLTATGLTWTQAEQAAVALGGHLVTINDAAENDWILANFGPPAISLWIGLYQPPGSPEPAGGWVWINGEPVTYTNWAPGEPNQFLGSPQDRGVMQEPGNANGPGKWDDDADAATSHGGVVERDCPPGIDCPTVSEWGLVVMTLLTLTAGTIILVRPRLARV